MDEFSDFIDKVYFEHMQPFGDGPIVTIVIVRLVNGVVLTDTSTCDVNEYDKENELDNCIDTIKYELSYLLEFKQACWKGGDI
jgi:hypothetical protein